MEVLPVAFVRDVCVAFARIRMGALDADAVMHVCDYHEHRSNAERAECGARGS
jgi:hypothetical protein